MATTLISSGSGFVESHIMAEIERLAGKGNHLRLCAGADNNALDGPDMNWRECLGNVDTIIHLEQIRLNTGPTA